jgi:hypothetical protein
MGNVLNVTWNVLNVCVVRNISKFKIIGGERVVGGACCVKNLAKIAKSKIFGGERVISVTCSQGNVLNVPCSRGERA